MAGEIDPNRARQACFEASDSDGGFLRHAHREGRHEALCPGL